MKIGVKITLLIVIAVAGIAVVSIMSLSSIGTLNDMFTDIGNRPVKNSRLANIIIDDCNNLARQSAMLCFDSNDVARRVAEMDESAAELWLSVDTLHSNVFAPNVINILTEFEATLEEMKTQRAAFTEAFTSGNIALARQLRAGAYQAAISASLAKSMELTKATEKQVEEACYVTSNAEANTATTLLITIIAVVTIVLVIIAIIIMLGITRPLKKAVEAADRISQGDMNVDLETKSNDETGMLIRSMEHMVGSLNGTITDINTSIHKALSGELSYRADISKHKGAYQDLVKGTNDLVDAFVEPLRMCMTSLEHLASGNKELKEVNKEYKGDFNDIKKSLNTAIRTVYFILGEIVGTGEAAKKGDLSKRADTSKVAGAWVEMMSGLNGIVDAAEAIIGEAGVTLATMSTGDLTPRIRTDYPGKFGEMKDNINNLGDSLTDLISQLQEAIHTTASASAQISSTADSLAAATQEQSSQTDEVASAMEEMSRTVTDNAHSATRTADVARQSGDVATTGGRVVEQTVSKMKEIADVVRISATNIAKLGESSKKIGEIISVIDDIADQTNLLSLNAAIEAARAGEQGRGFAVVADSVGKLAVSTASATKEIADMIKGIQLDTEAAVRAMEKGTSEVQSGIELADNAGHSIQDILAGINDLLDMVNQIAAASEEQSATSEQISKNVSSISKVTADSARNIEDVATTANELAKMTDTLTSLVSQFKISVGNSHRLMA